jgi:hypothetical protein
VATRGRPVGGARAGDLPRGAARGPVGAIARCYAGHRTAMLQLRCYDDDLVLTGPSIFLAGPTAGGVQRTPWRAEALALLEAHGFAGVAVIPEFRDQPFAQAVTGVFGAPASPVRNLKATSYNILRWETTGIEQVTVVMFWMPFVLGDEGDPASLPGFTTRAEVSRELVRAPHRVVLGMPATGVVSGGHIRFHAHHHGVTVWETLDDTVRAAIAQVRTLRR